MGLGTCSAQSVGIFGSTNLGVNNTGAKGNVKAIFDISSSDKGLLIPRITSASRDTFTNIPTSLLFFNTTTNQYEYYNGATWSAVAAANTSWSLTGNSGTVDGTHFIGNTDDKPFNIRVNNAKAARISSGDNLFLGYLAGANSNVAVIDNIAIGDSALYAQSFATPFSSANVAIGNSALFSNNPVTTGNGMWNTAVGDRALRNNTTGLRNTANGNSALYSNTTGSYNTAIGSFALFYNTGFPNTATGSSALYANTTGINNTANGYYALYSNTTASQNIAIGREALYTQSYNNSGTAWNSDNVAVGYQALYSNQPTTSTNAYRNTGIGSGALRSNTTGTENFAGGFYAGYSTTTGILNTFVGESAGYWNVTGFQNTFVGAKAGANCDANSAYNTYFGSYSGNLASGNNNTYIGVSAGASNTGSIGNNTFIGHGSGAGGSSGAANTFVGRLSGNASTGSENVFLGDSAGISNTGSNKNIFIGFKANGSNSLTNAISIGYNSSVTASNTMVLGGTGADAVNVGIGTSLPLATLDITGDGGTVLIPRKSTAGDPAGPANGMIYYNANTNKFRIYENGAWADMVAGAASPWSRTAPYTYLTTGTDNVGIGTTSPSERLEVTGNGLFGTTSLGIKVSNLSVQQTGTASNIYLEGGSASGNVFVRPGTTGAFYVELPSTTKLLTVLSTGNVGIGTTAPKGKLHIAGDAALGDGTAANEGVVTVFLTNNTGAASVKGEIVIVDPAADNSFVKTTTAGHTSVIGVVYESGVAAGLPCRIAISGIVSVVADAATTRGQHCITGTTTAGAAGSVATPGAGTSIGVWLENVAVSGQGKVLLR